MATIDLCDLCGGKVKVRTSSIKMQGQIKQFHGAPPPPPDGFKYSDEQQKNSHGKISYKKVWDHFGNLVSETKYIEPPKRYKAVEVGYDLCENCFDKFILMFETIKKQYHLEKTEMKLIEEDYGWHNPFLGLLGAPEDE